MPRYNCLVCGKFVSNLNINRNVIVCSKCRSDIEVAPIVIKKIVNGRKMRRNRSCGHCNSTHVEYRVRTKDLYCRDCKGLTPLQKVCG